MSVIYTSGDFTVATACTLPELSAPLAGQKKNYILTQDFIQLEANFVPLDLNTAYPTAPFTSYVLVSEENKRDIGGNRVRWTRVYAQVPDSYDEPGGNYSYNFIGIFGNFGIQFTTVTGRDRFTRIVPVHLQRDFYLVGAGGSYPDWQSIPVVDVTIYYYSTPIYQVDYIGDNPPLTIATVPSSTQYVALVNADAADETSFSIIVEPSSITRWQGNIYMRETRAIKAI